MNEETINELIRVAQESNNGNFIPLAILGGVFSMIILLLLYIWNQFVKSNNDRHERCENTLDKIEDNQTALRILSQKYDTKLESHQGQISDNRRKLDKIA